MKKNKVRNGNKNLQLLFTTFTNIMLIRKKAQSLLIKKLIEFILLKFKEKFICHM